jgi:hypothetical protein
MSEHKGSGWDKVLQSAVIRDKRENQAAYAAVSPSTPSRSGGGSWLRDNAVLVIIVIAAVLLFLWRRHH